VDDDETIDVDLGPESYSAEGQEIQNPRFSSMSTVEIEIVDVSAGDPAVAASRAGVGFTEIDLGRGPTTELIRVPVDAHDVPDDTALAIVLTRLRTDPSNPWRSDPEPGLVRSFSLATPRIFETDLTLRLDRNADDATIAALLSEAGVTTTALADRRLTGSIEARGASAVDGDPDTSWVTPFDGALGATLSFTTTEPLQTIDLLQPSGQFSPITMIRLDNGSTALEVPVPPPDELGRSTVTLPTQLAAGPTSLTISGVDARTTIDRRYGDIMTVPAAIAELSSPGIVPSDVELSAVISAECVDGLLSIDDEPVPVSFSIGAGALLAGEAVSAQACNGPIALDPGDHRVVWSDDASAALSAALSALTVDRVVLADSAGAAGANQGPIGVTVERQEMRERTVTVDACPDGCWLILGEGYNDAWRASIDDRELGDPELVDGGFNGWWLPPSDRPVTIELRWTAQAPVAWGLVIGVLSSAMLVLVMALSRRVSSPMLTPPVLRGSNRGRARAGRAAVVLIVAAAVLIAPIWGLIALAPAALVIWSARRPRPWLLDRPLELFGLAAAVAVVVSALVIERSERPFPDAGWTLAFDHLNGLAAFSVLSLAVGAIFAPDAEPSSTT
jgi:arabinofuranan 3-O-arabinosyltransferase